MKKSECKIAWCHKSFVGHLVSPHTDAEYAANDALLQQPAPSHPSMTERQIDGWVKAVARANKYLETDVIPDDIYHWTVTWAPESRPGRGHDMNALYLDGMSIVEVFMDVYGYSCISAGHTDWDHSDADEECGCDVCKRELEEQDDEEAKAQA